MALSVPYGNGLFFRREDGQLSSFDNTFLCGEAHLNTLNKSEFYNVFLDTDTLVIQIKVTNGDVPTMTFSDYTSGLSGAVALSLESSYTTYDFYQSSFSLSGYAGHMLDFTVQNSGDDDWVSEPISVLDADAVSANEYYLIEWFNFDPTNYGSTTENFEMDYTTGIVPFMRLPLMFKDYEPQVEVSTYENLDEVVKLREKVKRALTMKTDIIPRYLAEKLTIATAHDVFSINDVVFIRKEEPKVSNFDGFNFVDFEAVLTQANVVGLNSTDIGFDCETVMACKVDNQSEENVSSNTSFSILENHGLDIITVWYNSGTDVLLKFGTTVGGAEIGQLRPSAGDVNETLNVPQDLAKTGTSTLYVDVSGTSVDVDIFVRTIQNRE